MNNKLYKNKKGITLIALVITIIVLLLLAGISISMLSGQDGILSKASEAKTETKEKEIYEGLVLAVETALVEGLGKVDLSDGGSLEKALGSNYNYLGEGLVEKDGKYYTVKEDGTIIEGKEGEEGGESTEVVTSYTQEDIDNSGGKLVAIGATDPLYVVVAFNDDFTSATVTKNGDDSDGLMMTWTDKTAERTNPIYLNKSTLTSVVVEEGVANIGSRLFYASGAISVSTPKSVTVIDAYAFYSSGVTSVEILGGEVGGGAFTKCYSLTSVTIGKNVTAFSQGVFAESTEPKNVYISDLAAWCNISFYHGESHPLNSGGNLYVNGVLATDLTIPNSVSSIGNYAFFNCKSLTSVTIPNSVSSIGVYAFGSTSLTSVTIPNSVTSIDNHAFTGCKSLASITIANSVTSIGNYAFNSCGLTSVTIPNSVSSIGDHAFSACNSLASITIANSVTSIGQQAFSGCSILENINYEGTTEQWNAMTFGTEWNNNTPAYTIHCTNGDIAKS